jgi:DNA-binding MarR family transcriptional regulator
MLDKNSNTSRIVKKLETKKLIDIAGHETDKRFYQIGISKKGLDLLAKIDIEFKNNPPHKAFLSESEAKKLNDLLDKMRG